MKRSSPLQRTAPLARTTGLRVSSSPGLGRHEPPDRKSPLARHMRKPKLGREPKPAAEWELERIAAIAFHDTVVGRGSCVMCRHFPVTPEIRETYAPELRRREAHHVIAKRHLKTHGLTWRRFDSDNGLALCAFHHERHEKAVQRVPLALLPRRALRFAHEVGLSWILDREYAP